MGVDCYAYCNTTPPVDPLPTTTSTSTSSTSTTVGCKSKCKWKSNPGATDWVIDVNPCPTDCPCSVPAIRTPKDVCDTVDTPCSSATSSTTTTLPCQGDITYRCAGGTWYKDGVCKGGGCRDTRVCRPNLTLSGACTEGATATAKCVCNDATSTTSSTSTTPIPCTGIVPCWVWDATLNIWHLTGNCGSGYASCNPPGSEDIHYCRSVYPTRVGYYAGESLCIACTCADPTTTTSTTSTTTTELPCSSRTSLWYAPVSGPAYRLISCSGVSDCYTAFPFPIGIGQCSDPLYDDGGFGPLPAYQTVPCSCVTTAP